ncbi:dipeptide/oligopeptide/nickel ABC transporter ATP-binding protein [Domibacillus sp. A3M-37]|uniref:ABC transporter ATP-binding protein n=1 Tax=Domibacillus sp. A3M-37 TaxID=2962037 RepID=UPI0020B799A1|nr:dipeptide/oligopeptide/nickel ABC transporter ATP-binding protein [Domibacillus sp. A3M-37]MCP3764378.1 dipeptide/oligopeptide/nickel ABC transporter ATP-binding protein [Domibacillus sp. A3M-37]
MLEVKNVSKSYQSNTVLADISFHIEQGECLGLIGESGSGKSTMAKLILALDRFDSGQIMLHNVDFTQLKGRNLRKARRHVQVVFQDPSASLNPKLPVWKSVIEPLENYPEVTPSFLKGARKEKRKMAEILFEKTGLHSGLLDRHPHQLSGGQRQRVAIARGISLQPSLLILDEPTSSLDVSIQAQILNLLKDLKNEINISYLFISHDIATVQYMSERIAVLKEGRLVDLFSTKDLFSEERHSYTKELIEAALE